MGNFYLQVTATLLCLILGSLASWCVLVMNLEGIGLVLASTVGVACLPLGLFMAHTTIQEHK